MSEESKTKKKGISKEKLLKSLKFINSAEYQYDAESAHGEADQLLLKYINDTEIELAYNAIEKWYA